LWLNHERKIKFFDRRQSAQGIEHGLRHALSQHKQHRRFRLRKATFKGRGLSATARGAGWEQLRELAYEGRGG
jgi:hypothetical protein